MPAAPARGAARRRARAARIGFALSPLVGAHLALLAAPLVPPTVWSLALVLVVTRFTGLGITVGFHRYFSHRSFKTSRWFQFALAVAGCSAMQKGPLWWVVHHRLHHQHSDRDGDPHSPVKDGFWYGHCGWLFTRDLIDPDRRLVRDWLRFPELVWLDRLWMVPGLLLAGVCYAALGWAGLLYGFCLSVVLVFQVTFAVNSFGHLFGPRRFNTGEGSRNNLVLGYLAMGDGWHNNHHRAPGSARHGFAWYEFDFSYLAIRGLRWVGLVWGVRLPPPHLLNGEDRPPAEGPDTTAATEVDVGLPAPAAMTAAV